MGSPDFQNDSSLSRLASQSRRIWWVTKSEMRALAVVVAAVAKCRVVDLAGQGNFMVTRFG